MLFSIIQQQQKHARFRNDFSMVHYIIRFTYFTIRLRRISDYIFTVLVQNYTTKYGHKRFNYLSRVFFFLVKSAHISENNIRVVLQYLITS